MTLQHRTIESKETFIEGLKEIKAKFKQFGSYEVDLTDDQLKAELFDFQVIGLKWLLFLFYNNWNGILADEMGCGKTIQTLAFLSQLSKRLDAATFLVLCPLSVLKQWIEEIKAKAPHLNYIEYTGSKEERLVKHDQIIKRVKSGESFMLLTNYEMILKEEEFLKGLNYSYLVVDEGHRLKNDQSILYQKLLNEFSISKKLILTGTPVQNNLRELNNLFRFLNPDLFPADNTLMEKWFSDLSELQDHICPFILRREISDTSVKLPLSREVVVYTRQTKLQQDLYKSILAKEGFATTMKGMNNVLMQLRKCVDHPYLFHGIEPEPFEIGDHIFTSSGKLWLLDKVLREIIKKGHKVLVFSQFTTMLDIIQDYLDYREYSYQRLDGSVKSDERFLAVNKFKSQQDCNIFLLSTRAGGLGLNLVEADTVIFYDTDFNPQMDLQAAARVYRIGQTKNCLIIRLIVKNSVEEIILKRAQLKRLLSEKLLQKGKFKVVANESKEEDFSVLLKFGLSEMDKQGELTDEELELIVSAFFEDESLYSGVEKEQQKLEELTDEDLEDVSNNIYEYLGHDYTKDRQLKDDEAFNFLCSSEYTDNAAVGKRKILASSSKEIDYEALERERKRRIIELKKKKEERMHKLWGEHDYKSMRLLPKESSSRPKIDIDMDTINQNWILVRGSIQNPVTLDQTSLKKQINYICYPFDNSGEWYPKGIFALIDGLSDGNISKNYKLMHDMKDLKIGQAYLFPINDELNYVGLCCQKRTKHGVSGIDLTHLEAAMRDFAESDQLHNTDESTAVLHLPRFPASDTREWYVIERLFKKYFCSKSIPVFLYYYKKRA